MILSSLLAQDARDFEFKLQQAERWKREAAARDSSNQKEVL